MTLFNTLPTQEQKATWGDGLVPFISLASNTNELENLQNPNEILVQETQARIIINTPSNNKPNVFDITNPNGFSRKYLVEFILQKYHNLTNNNDNDILKQLQLTGLKIYQNQQGMITIGLQIQNQ